MNQVIRKDEYFNNVHSDNIYANVFISQTAQFNSISTQSLGISEIINIGTLTLPTQTCTLIGNTTFDTLLNKVIESPVINNPIINNFVLSNPSFASIFNVGTVYLPNITTTLVGNNTFDTLINKIINNATLNNPTVNNISLVNPSFSKIINIGTLFLPTSTTSLIGDNTFDVLTNKTLNSCTYNNGTYNNVIMINPNMSKIINSGTLFLPSTSTSLIGNNTNDTLTNKSLVLPNISQIQNNLAILTLPSTTSSLSSNILNETLTNKTIITPTIASIFNSGLLTLPSGPDFLISRSSTDNLSNKSLISPLLFNSGNQIFLFSSSDTLIGRSTTDNLSNKSLISPLLFNSGNQIFLFSSTDTLIGRSTTDNLSNKSLISPLLFNSGNQIFLFSSSDTLIGRSTTDNLSNKSLISPLLFNSGNQIFLPSSFTSLIGNNTNDTLTNKTLDSCTYNDGTYNNVIMINPSFSKIINIGTIFIPDVTSTLSTTSLNETLQNKNIINSSLSNVTLTNAFLNDPNIAKIINSGTLFLPSTSTSLIGNNTTDNLSNKNLISPTMSSILVNNFTISFPNSLSDTLVTRSNLETLQNKVIINSTFSNITVTNISLSDLTISNVTLIDPVISKIINIGTLTLPNVTSSLSSNLLTETLQNKTIITPTIASIFNSGLLTLPNGPDFLISRSSTDNLSNKNLISPTMNNILVNGFTLNFPSSLSDTLIGRSTTDNLTNKNLISPTMNNVLVNNFTISFPNSLSDTLVTRSNSETLQNKVIINSTISDINLNNITLTNAFLVDPSFSKIINIGTLFLPSSSTSLIGNNTTDNLSNKSLILPTMSSILVNNFTLSFPNSLSDTLVTRSNSETLQNKNIINSTFSNIIVSNITLNNAVLNDPSFSKIINSGTLFLPSSTTSLIGNNTTDNLSNKSLISPLLFNSGNQLFLPSSSTSLIGNNTTDNLSNKNLISPTMSNILVNNFTISFPNSLSDTLVTRSNSETLQNKNIINSSLSNITLSGVLSSSTLLSSVITNSSISSCTISTSIILNPTMSTIQVSGQTLSFPQITNTLSTLTGSETLSNKNIINSTLNNVTLSSSLLINPIISGVAGTQASSSVLYFNPSSTAFTGSNNYFGSYFKPILSTGSTSGSAYTMYIENAPSNATNPYSFYVNSGASYFGGNINIPTGAVSGYRLTSSSLGLATWQADKYGDINYIELSQYFTVQSTYRYNNLYDAAQQSFALQTAGAVGIVYIIVHSGFFFETKGIVIPTGLRLRVTSLPGYSNMQFKPATIIAYNDANLTTNYITVGDNAEIMFNGVQLVQNQGAAQPFQYFVYANTSTGFLEAIEVTICNLAGCQFFFGGTSGINLSQNYMTYDNPTYVNGIPLNCNLSPSQYVATYTGLYGLFFNANFNEAVTTNNNYISVTGAFAAIMNNQLSGIGILLNINSGFSQVFGNQIGSTLNTTSMQVHNSSIQFNTNQYDAGITVYDVNSSVFGQGNSLAKNRLDFTAANIANINLTFTETDAKNISGFVSYGAINVGDPSFPSETWLGQGRINISGNTFMRFNSSGSTYTDLTSNLYVTSTSNTTIYTNVNDIFYIGNDIQFSSVVLYVSVAQVSSIPIFEYGNNAGGTTYTTFNIMNTQGVSPYGSYANVPFTAANEIQEIRFDRRITLSTGIGGVAWVKGTVNGMSKYWIRIRITSLTTSTQLKYAYIVANSIRFDTTGFSLFYGGARKLINIPIFLNVFQPAGTATASQDVWFGNQSSCGLANNEFKANGSRLGTGIIIPPYIDTSTPLNIWICFRNLTTAATQTGGSFNITSGTVFSGTGTFTAQPAAGNNIPNIHTTAAVLTPNQTDGSRAVFQKIQIPLQEVITRSTSGNVSTLLSIDFTLSSVGTSGTVFMSIAFEALAYVEGAIYT